MVTFLRGECRHQSIAQANTDIILLEKANTDITVLTLNPCSHALMGINILLFAVITSQSNQIFFANYSKLAIKCEVAQLLLMH